MLFLHVFEAKFTGSQKGYSLLLHVTVWACKGTKKCLKQTIFVPISLA